MRARISLSVFVVLTPLFVLGLFDYSLLCAAKVESQSWSLDLENASISEALRQLTQTTGIKIFAKNPPESKLLTKYYKNQTIDQILWDILRNVNHALVWHFSEKGLDSISVLIFDRAGSGKPTDLSRARVANPRSRSAARNLSYNQQRHRKHSSGTEQEKDEEVPE